MSRSCVCAVRLLEREDELAALDAVLIEGGVLVVEGGAGVGRTSLLAAAAERAAGLGHEVVRARGSELEAGFAFGVVRQLFERRLVLAPAEERAGRCSRALRQPPRLFSRAGPLRAPAVTFRSLCSTACTGSPPISRLPSRW